MSFDTQSSHPDPSGPPGESGPRVIALMNQKGGVGKTTTTLNLGAALMRAGQRVLLVDLDPQAHLTLHVGVDPDSLEQSNYHLLTDPEATAAAIVQQLAPELGLLPADLSLAGVEGELAGEAAQGRAQHILRDKTVDLVQQFDFVLIDCPPSLGMLTVNALALAREIVVPMQAHFLALQGLSRLLETVQMVNQQINPALRVLGVVLCMHEGQTLLAGEVSQDLRDFLDAARGSDVPWSDAVLLEPPVRRNIKLAECPSFGQSIFDYAPDSRGAADYAALAKAIVAHRPATLGAGRDV